MRSGGFYRQRRLGFCDLPVIGFRVFRRIEGHCVSQACNHLGLLAHPVAIGFESNSLRASTAAENSC